MSDQWETFCDVGYYHMWRLRRKTERGWNDGFHINTKAEAEGLCELLNKLEGELNDYRNLAFQSERKLEEAQQQLLVKRSNNRRLDARNKRLEHESEKLKEELESHAWTISPAMAQAKIDELVEQRDRLAEALREDDIVCPHCGSDKDPFFSRIEPMGDYCPDCGKERA